MQTNKPSSWGYGPTASLDVLKKRAQLLKQLRACMDERGVLEADVPVMGRCAVSDPFIQSLSACDGKGQSLAFLQTSPEYYLKRLLASGFGDVYYLGPAFREDEHGSRHRAEFTMLEWYRVGLDDRQLMQEMTELFLFLQPGLDCQNVSYKQAFKDALGICPHTSTVAQLKCLAQKKTGAQFDSPMKSVWLDLLFSHCVEPALPKGLSFVFDFPSCMGALAKLTLDADGQEVARRFECYWNGMELANGYCELTDAEEQAKRFANDNAARRDMGLPEVQIDQRFLKALKAGLPDCAGVAMGVDRLLMCLTQMENISQVMPFADM